MTEFVTAHEATIRMAFFVGIFLAVALVELIVLRRALTTSKTTRWVGNIGIVFINTVVLRLLFPAGAVGISLWIGHQGWGIFNHVQWPFWLEAALTIVILDLGIRQLLIYRLSRLKMAVIPACFWPESSSFI